MKKSQLRKIIRESIKELIFEQDRGKTNYSGIDGSSGVTLIPPKSRELQLREQGNTPCTNGAYMTLEACPNSYHWTGTYMAGPWHCYCCTRARGSCNRGRGWHSLRKAGQLTEGMAVKLGNRLARVNWVKLISGAILRRGKGGHAGIVYVHFLHTCRRDAANRTNIAKLRKLPPCGRSKRKGRFE